MFFNGFFSRRDFKGTGTYLTDILFTPGQDFIPEYAKRYGFEYEYVQYKWPRWLNQQSEKQRTIWGYKILFLDVLFPLSLKKIIFVDTDQGRGSGAISIFQIQS